MMAYSHPSGLLGSLAPGKLPYHAHLAEVNSANVAAKFGSQKSHRITGNTPFDSGTGRPESDLVFLYLIDQPMFLIDASRPTTGQFVLQGFGLAQT